jgi:hypothetical protein
MDEFNVVVKTVRGKGEEEADEPPIPVKIQDQVGRGALHWPSL